MSQLTLFYTSISGLVLLSFFFIIREAFKTKNLINPISFFFGYDIIVLTIFSLFVSNSIFPDEIIGYNLVILNTYFYIISFIFGKYICSSIKINKHVNIFENLLQLNRTSVRFDILKPLFLIFFAVLIFLIIVLKSSAGLLWFTNPRDAYITGRAGIGFLWILYQWVLMFFLSYTIWYKSKNITQHLIYFIIFSFLVFFSGSKANIFSGLLFLIFYYHYFNKKKSNYIILFLPIIFFSIFFLLFLLQFDQVDFFNTIAYFSDYSHTTALFLENFKLFNLHYGYATFSDLWFYLPRAIYPNKPYEYGITLIHKVLFPDSAELGHTPGVLNWALSYLDFGIIGVMLAGFFSGFIRTLFFNYFLFKMEKPNLIFFLLMCHISLFSIFSYATFLLTILLLLFFSFLIRLFYK